MLGMDLLLEAGTYRFLFETPKRRFQEDAPWMNQESRKLFTSSSLTKVKVGNKDDWVANRDTFSFLPLRCNQKADETKSRSSGKMRNFSQI
jgi:hypothetical protein